MIEQYSSILSKIQNILKCNVLLDLPKLSLTVIG